MRRFVRPLIEGIESKFDLIVSNPPYVSETEFAKLEPNVRDYEPRRALYGGVDGLDVYRRILNQAGDFLKPDGALMMESATPRARHTGINRIIRPVCPARIEKDLSKNDRVVMTRKTTA
jgi:release factor glutamine methyltransferase